MQIKRYKLAIFPFYSYTNANIFSCHSFSFSRGHFILAGQSVWSRQRGTSVKASLLGTKGSLVGLMEQRREYQLKGYKYLKAEIFNNIRVVGPETPQLTDESGGMINVSRHPGCV